MSLINEALKKAQRLRTGDPADLLPSTPGAGPRVAKRGTPRSTQQLILIAAGGLVLAVLSIVGTFWFINRAPSPPAPAPAVAKTTGPAAPTPAIAAPIIKPPVVVAEIPAQAAAPTPTTPPVKPTVPPEHVAVEPAATAATNSAAPLAGTPPPTTTAAGSIPTDPRVHDFIDAIRVAGIRSSGDDSRVLMNDRVYRVNDIVERNLGVRLVKVGPDSLTFTDANGAVYVKNF